MMERADKSQYSDEPNLLRSLRGVHREVASAVLGILLVVFGSESAIAQPVISVVPDENVVGPPDDIVAPPDPPSLGPVIARIRILTHNVYGVGEDDCETRGETFGLHVANGGYFRGQPFDIVGLQEYYEYHRTDFGAVCNDEPLLDAAQSRGGYLNSDYMRLFRPVVSGQHNGGVGILTLHPIVQTDDWRWSNDTQSWPEAVEGFLFARIRLPGTELLIDTYVVHLNSGGENREVRESQLEQLASRVAEFSLTSGNPVIVMGDFNIGGPQPRRDPPGNPGYSDIVRILRFPNDLWLNANSQTDPSEGYTTGCGLFANFEGCLGTERIDYIFYITDSSLTNSPYQVKVSEIRRVRWAEPTHISPPHIHYVSDHFGVDATIEIRRSPTP